MWELFETQHNNATSPKHNGIQQLETTTKHRREAYKKHYKQKQRTSNKYETTKKTVEQNTNKQTTTAKTKTPLSETVTSENDKKYMLQRAQQKSKKYKCWGSQRFKQQNNKNTKITYRNISLCSRMACFVQLYGVLMSWDVCFTLKNMTH